MKQKILIAEDEAHIQSCLKFVLSDYELTFESTGRDAFEKHQTNTFDLLITDFNMPKMNGLELIQKVRKGSSKMPIILMSGDFSSFIKKKAKKLGVEAFIDKPFSQVTLFEDVVSGLLNS